MLLTYTVTHPLGCQEELQQSGTQVLEVFIDNEDIKWQLMQGGESRKILPTNRIKH